MKTFALLAVLIFTFSYAKESNESKFLEEEIAEFVQDKFNSTIIFDLMGLVKLAKDKCPDIEDKLVHANKKIAKCVMDIELGTETVCSLIRNHWKECSQPGYDSLASCLPEESKALPAMAGKIIGALIDRACNSTVEESWEIFNTCVVSETASNLPCTELNDALLSHEDKFPTKSFVCSLIPKAKGCAKVHEEDCKNPITKAASHHFSETVEDAVKDDCNAA